MHYMTHDEFTSLTRHIRSPRDRALFLVAFWRGLRASEVGLLTVDSVDLERGRIQVRRLKGSDSSEYRLHPAEEKALRAWLRVRGRRPGPLFPSRGAVRPISRSQLHRLIRRYGAAAGLPVEKLHFHVLKHSIAVYLMDRGADVADVRDYLGHRNVQNTMIYAQVTNRRREEFAKRIYEERRT